MSAVILPFRRPPKPSQMHSECESSTLLEITLSARGGTVTLGATDVEIDLSPAGARELARDLLELADDADGARP